MRYVPFDIDSAAPKWSLTEPAIEASLVGNCCQSDVADAGGNEFPNMPQLSRPTNQPGDPSRDRVSSSNEASQLGKVIRHIVVRPLVARGSLPGSNPAPASSGPAHHLEIAPGA